MTTLLDLFETHKGLLANKYPHHLEAYETFFARFKSIPSVSILEIGVAHGGSLQIWRKYFGTRARIFGVDVQDMRFLSDEADAKILIGDQGDASFWSRNMRELLPLHIVIDDGSHFSGDQKTTLLALFDKLEPNGIYAIEDLQTSYRNDYGGGYRNEHSFIEYVKQMIDWLHDSEDGVPVRPRLFDELFAVHAYPGLVIIEKRSPSTWGGATVRGLNA